MPDSEQLKPWHTISTATLLDVHPWFSVLCDTIELPSGKVIDDYYRIKAPDYVLICAMNQDGRVLLERHYKPCVGKFVLTCPAGGVDDHEEPLFAAKRELLEETGYEAEEWHKIGEFTVDGTRGICNAHFFTAKKLLKTAEPEHNEMEEFELMFLGASEIENGIKDGLICLMPDIAILSMTNSWRLV